uniref:Cuticle protein 6 n=1 Tax=Glossina brevipalpis TaxID=37001 RepID=A0A1A9X0K3_9MUSC
MRFFIILSIVMGLGQMAQSALLLTSALRSYPFLYGAAHTSSVITPVQQQYHTQDELGQYAYGYSDPLSSKQEVRSLDGVTQGSYSYVDPEGLLQTVDYTADENGFRVAATNLPKPEQNSKYHTAATTISIPIASVPDTSAATVAIPTTTIAANTDSESINAISSSGPAIHTSSGLRLASGSTTHTKFATDTAHVRSLELSQPVADTTKMATAGTILIKGQPHELIFSTPVALTGYPSTISRSLIPKASRDLIGVSVLRYQDAQEDPFFELCDFNFT